MQRRFWFALSVFVWLYVCFNVVSAVFWLFNQPSDIAIWLGILIVLATYVLVPTILWAIWSKTTKKEKENE